MSFENYITFFKGLKTENSSKRELKVYNSFIRLFNDLIFRNFSATEIAQIENELELLDLKLDTSRKALSKKLQQFIDFLKTKFSLISESHYTGTYMAIGMCFGLVFGISLGIVSSSIGMLLGMLIGIALGSEKDKKAKEEGRVLNIKSSESFF